jgi:hypothetical protein
VLTAAIIAAAIGAGTAIYGGVKASQAEKEQQRIAGKQQQLADQNAAEISRQLKTDYLQTAAGSAAAQQAKEDLREHADRVQSAAAMTGATHQAQTAARQGVQKQYASAVRGIAANANQYQQNLLAWKNALSNQQQALYGQQANAYGQQALAGQNVMSSGLNTMGAAASLYALGAQPATTTATTGATTGAIKETRIPSDVGNTFTTTYPWSRVGVGDGFTHHA